MINMHNLQERIETLTHKINEVILEESEPSVVVSALSTLLGIVINSLEINHDRATEAFCLCLKITQEHVKKTVEIPTH